jgi:hypothetical protein
MGPVEEGRESKMKKAFWCLLGTHNPVKLNQLLRAFEVSILCTICRERVVVQKLSYLVCSIVGQSFLCIAGQQDPQILVVWYCKKSKLVIVVNKQVTVVWQVVCPAKALLFPCLWADFSIFFCKHVMNKFCSSWILRWLHGEWLRAKTDTKMEAGMLNFSPAFS